MTQKESDLNFYAALKKLKENNFMKLNNTQMLNSYIKSADYGNIPTKENNKQVK